MELFIGLAVDVRILFGIQPMVELNGCRFGRSSIRRNTTRDRYCDNDEKKYSTHVPTLPQLAFDFFQPVRPLQYFTRLASVRWTYDAFVLHHVENASGTAVAQTQPALQS